MFSIGDKVKLVAMDCPEMTVAGVSGPNGADVLCRWFGKEGDFYERCFHAEELATPEDADLAIREAKAKRAEKVALAQAEKKAAEKTAEEEAKAAEKAAEEEAKAAEKAARAEAKTHAEPHATAAKKHA